MLQHCVALQADTFFLLSAATMKNRPTIHPRFAPVILRSDFASANRESKIMTSKCPLNSIRIEGTG